MSEILDDSAAKWDAHGPGLRLINLFYVKLPARRWPDSLPVRPVKLGLIIFYCVKLDGGQGSDLGGTAQS